MFIPIVADSASNHRRLHLDLKHINLSHIVSLEKSWGVEIASYDKDKLVEDNEWSYPITLSEDLFDKNEKGEYNIEGCKIYLSDKELVTPEPLQHFIDRCETERLNKLNSMITKVKEEHPDLDRQTIEHLGRSLEI